MRIMLIYVINITNFILDKALNPLRLKEITDWEGEGENVERGEKAIIIRTFRETEDNDRRCIYNVKDRCW